MNGLLAERKADEKKNLDRLRSDDLILVQFPVILLFCIKLCEL